MTGARTEKEKEEADKIESEKHKRQKEDNVSAQRLNFAARVQAHFIPRFLHDSHNSSNENHLTISLSKKRSSPFHVTRCLHKKLSVSLLVVHWSRVGSRLSAGPPRYVQPF